MTDNRPDPFGQYAQRLSHLGYAVVPIAPGQKRPAISHWQTAYQHQSKILSGHFERHGVGILCRGLAAIDIDVLDKATARIMRDFVMDTLGVTDIPMRVGKFPKVLMLLRRAEGPMPKMSSSYWRDGEGVLHRIEVLGDGQQFVAYGTHADTGKAYVWKHMPIAECDLDAGDLQPITTEQLQDILDHFDQVAEEQGWERVTKGSNGTTGGDVPWPVAGLTLDLAAEALEHYPNSDLHYDQWLACGMALHQQFAGYDEAFELWDYWSQGSGKDRGTSVNWKHWQSFAEDRPGGLTMRTILREAELNGWHRPASVEGAPASVDDFADLESPSEPPVSDSQGADEFPVLPDSETENAKPDAADAAEAAVKPRSGPWTPALGFTADAIPKRDWVIPGLLMRGHVTGLAGPPGVAKSTFELARAVSICTGRDLLGDVITATGPVLLVNNEDDIDEIQRRLVALQIAHGISNKELHNNLYIWSGYGDPVRFAERRDRHSRLERTKGVPKLISWCKKHGIVSLFVDPLISTALGAEENDNNDMDAVVSIWKGIADEAQVSVSLTHHTRKSNSDSEAHAGDAQTFRGGGAFIGAVRLAYTLASMSKATQKQLGLPGDEGRRLVRADNAKSNYHLPDADATWYRLDSILLPSGDSVGVPMPADLDALERLDTGEGDVEDRENFVRRSRIVEMYEADVEAASLFLFSISLSKAAERWMAERDVTKRTAMEQIKRLVPEGGLDRAVTVAHGTELYDLWREERGEGRGARYSLCIRKHGTDEDSWMG